MSLERNKSLRSKSKKMKLRNAWTNQVKEEHMKVELSREDAHCLSR